jgi:pimeloyl-ACP methyl ester carboxylesterase
MLWRPAEAAVYRLEDMADDAVTVLDALGWKSAHVVGRSLGGMIAQTMVVRHPRRRRGSAGRLGRGSTRALCGPAERREA